MGSLTKGILLGALLACCAVHTPGQTGAATIPTSVDARLVMDAAGPLQRQSLNAIYLIECTDARVGGSGFLLDSGIVVTNVHVVASCNEQNLVGISTANKRIAFSRIIRDPQRDLALLVPTDALTGGLKLAASSSPLPGTEVTTWGYPFFYNGTSPLLSVGYVAGYREDNSNGKAVKHVIVNGAFNHGNSGGPLLVRRHNEVIGVVVLTYNFYPPQLKQIIDMVAQTKTGMLRQYQLSDGTTRMISEDEIIGGILNEFYEKTQVVIGEAIASSELAAMIREHSSELTTNRAE